MYPFTLTFFTFFKIFDRPKWKHNFLISRGLCAGWTNLAPSEHFALLFDAIGGACDQKGKATFCHFRQFSKIDNFLYPNWFFDFSEGTHLGSHKKAYFRIRRIEPDRNEAKKILKISV